MKLVINNLNEIGPHLRQIRLAKKISMRAMVEKTNGISATTIAKVETGNNYPSLGTLTEWLKALGYDEITIRFGGSPE